MKSQTLFQVGRYVVATRDIEPLELILVDTPAIYGPNHDSVPACMECLLPVDGNYLCERYYIKYHSIFEFDQST